MNVEIGTETPIFLFWEYLFRNLGILSLQCIHYSYGNQLRFQGNHGKKKKTDRERVGNRYQVPHL